jgi:hypothetical protein
MSVDVSEDAALMWLFEVSPSEGNLSPLRHRAITTTNVVIYDRELAPIVAAAPPLGGYAEPVAPGREALGQTIEHCLRFVLDGWSVARLVDHNKASEERIRRIRHLSERLAARNFPSDLPVLLFSDVQVGRYRKIGTELSVLEIEFDAASRERALAVSFGPIGTAASRELGSVMSNGLAG